MKNKTDQQTKIFARLIIFVTMAYIIFVDSTILIQHMDGFWNCDGCDLRLNCNLNPYYGAMG
jgi:xanthine/uracil/vitamin C permease (AzgA family)